MSTTDFRISGFILVPTITVKAVKVHISRPHVASDQDMGVVAASGTTASGHAVKIGNGLSEGWLVGGIEQGNAIVNISSIVRAREVSVPDALYPDVISEWLGLSSRYAPSSAQRGLGLSLVSIETQAGDGSYSRVYTTARLGDLYQAMVSGGGDLADDPKVVSACLGVASFCRLAFPGAFESAEKELDDIFETLSTIGHD